MAIDKIVQFEYEWQLGSRVTAREIAKSYVDEHRQTLESLYGRYTLEELVAKVEQFRALGQESDRIIVDMWLLVEYQSQAINVESHAAVEAVESLLRGNA